jgi:2-succinyl-6-hydroxy-2,4-cyclohexadiene-1-carboxylate synthase
MIAAIHGFTGSPELWRGLALDLQALTVLGHGPSAPAQGDETFASEVERLAAHLPERGTDLVGYSLGARLSLAIAIRYPDRIASLSLIGVHPGLPTEGEQRARRAADQRWIERLQTEGIESFVSAWESLPMWRSQQALPEAVLERQRQERLGQDPQQLAHALGALGTGVMPPMWEALSSLTVPVHLIVGEGDDKFLAIAESMLSRLSDGRMSVVPGSGHNPVLENPEFLRQLLAGSYGGERVARYAR